MTFRVSHIFSAGVFIVTLGVSAGVLAAEITPASAGATFGLTCVQTTGCNQGSVRVFEAQADITDSRQAIKNGQSIAVFAKAMGTPNDQEQALQRYMVMLRGNPFNACQFENKNVDVRRESNLTSFLALCDSGTLKSVACFNKFDGIISCVLSK